MKKLILIVSAAMALAGALALPGRADSKADACCGCCETSVCGCKTCTCCDCGTCPACNA